MTTRCRGQSGVQVAACVFAVTVALALGQAQSQEPAAGVSLGVVQGSIQGFVHDSGGEPLANATVSILLAAESGIPATTAQVAHTDSKGAYRFAALPPGAYSLRAHLNGYDDAVVGPVSVGPVSVGPVSLAAKGTRKIDLVLASTKDFEKRSAPAITATGKLDAPAPEFYDEPQFTVAGVTAATNSGGHGSDTVLRTSEALARATVSLSKEPSAAPDQPPAAAESALRDAVARDPKDAALHHQLGEIEEKLGNPLEAVREYQHAAELDPSEQYLFDWGTELLSHRALEPAAEVFTKGNRLFPKSVRMLIALAVADYARGSYDQAAQCLASASDLAPGDETPYLFMGKMQGGEAAPSPETRETLERLARFQRLEPGNALANYYYAASLWKARQSTGALDDATSTQVETLLQKAIGIDPRLGAAHLQLGIHYAQRGDYTHAILAYRTAIEASPELAEAHYRLAQAYRRTGKDADAQKELQIHEELSKAAKEEAQRERREIQEFVISLRSTDSGSH